ncbi:MAG: DMT family transporter [Ignavibacteria bacterium]|nr:DMT family transporter [Ignavibacteria bacterium]
MINKIPEHRKGLILISLTAFLWSTSGFFIKFMSATAFQISFWRSLIAALTIFSVSLFRKEKLRIESDFISLSAAFFYAGILILFVIATKMTTAANAIFLQFTAPVYLVLLEPIVMKTKFEPKNIITVIICLFGMGLFFFGKLELGGIYGNILAIGSGICFAMFSLLLKYKREKHNSSNTIGIVIIGNLLVSAVTLPIIFPDILLDLTHTVILFYMGAVQIGISYMIFNIGIKYVSATESMIIATLEAVFNPIWVFIGLGEVPTVYSIIGGLIIFSAVIWRNLSRDEKSLIID